MTLQNFSAPQTAPQLMKMADALLSAAMNALPAPADGKEINDDMPGLLAMMAQAAAQMAQIKVELERSRSFIAANGIVISVDDIATVHVDYLDHATQQEGVLIVARTPVTRLDQDGNEKAPTTKTYKFFEGPGMALRAWFKSADFFSRFIAFDAGESVVITTVTSNGRGVAY